MAKRCAFVLAMIVLTWIAIELVAVAGHAIINQSLLPGSVVEAEIERVVDRGIRSDDTRVVGLDWEGYEYVEAVHPYFGYVVDPDQSAARYQVSPLGFHDPATDVSNLRKRTDQIIIGFFGGSFTWGTIDFARPALSKCLAFTEKKIVVRNFSAGGYKQPQQLHILTHLLATGVEFDIVINIDGFNEIALPFAENIPAGVHPLFPRRWHDRVAGFISPTRARKVGTLQILEESRSRWAESFRVLKLYRSPALALLWQYRDRRFATRIFNVREELRMLDADETTSDFQVVGPEFPHDDEGIFALIAQSWRGASTQMAKLAAGNDAHYLHFLQPNQYLKDTKPMSEAERSVAIVSDHPYRAPIVRGYPMLIDEGRALKQEGVAFYDLTQIYADVPEPLYIDACCHVNERGYEIVAERICEAVIELLDDGQEAGPPLN